MVQPIEIIFYCTITSNLWNMDYIIIYLSLIWICLQNLQEIVTLVSLLIRNKFKIRSPSLVTLMVFTSHDWSCDRVWKRTYRPSFLIYLTFDIEFVITCGNDEFFHVDTKCFCRPCFWEKIEVELKVSFLWIASSFPLITACTACTWGRNSRKQWMVQSMNTYSRGSILYN